MADFFFLLILLLRTGVRLLDVPTVLVGQALVECLWVRLSNHDDRSTKDQEYRLLETQTTRSVVLWVGEVGGDEEVAIAIGSQGLGSNISGSKTTLTADLSSMVCSPR